MQSKNHKSKTKAESAWIEMVKSQPCSVCDAPAPSSAHHIEQQEHFTVVALCVDCHQGSRNGWHGQRMIWKAKKMNELDALNVTIGRVYGSL